MIRWYDPMDETKWIGSQVIYVVNSGDRKLGQTGTLYLSMTKTQENMNTVAQMQKAATHNRTENNNYNFSQAAVSANIIQMDNNQYSLSENSDYNYKPGEVLPVNASEGLVASHNKAVLTSPIDFSLPENKNKYIVASNNQVASPEDYIGFNQNSSNYSGTLDNNNSNGNNEVELNRAVNRMTNNPSYVATVTGNASLETTTVSNQNLAQNRANTVKGKLTGAGISPSRVSTNVGYSQSSATPNNAIERNATIKYNIPR